MSCNCNKALSAGACIANLTIGAATAGTDYNVYLHTPSGRTDVYPVTSTGNGTIIVESPKLRTGTLYQVWINQPGDSTARQAPFTVGNTEVNCLNIEFTNCYNENEYTEPVDVTLALAD